MEKLIIKKFIAAFGIHSLVNLYNPTGHMSVLYKAFKKSFNNQSPVIDARL